jgi:hypothetical protein
LLKYIAIGKRLLHLTPSACISDQVVLILKLANRISDFEDELNQLRHPKNAGILAAQIVANFDKAVDKALEVYKKSIKDKVIESATAIEENGWKSRKVGF